MSDLLFAGAYAGGAAGAILTLLSHIAPWFGAGNFIHDLDDPQIFGRAISHREAHFLGILVHLIACIASGILFALGVERAWFSGFHVIPMLGWTMILLLASSVIVMPLEGHGFFGRKHDAWFVVDVFVTNLLWGGLYLLLIRLWT